MNYCDQKSGYIVQMSPFLLYRQEERDLLSSIWMWPVQTRTQGIMYSNDSSVLNGESRIVKSVKIVTDWIHVNNTVHKRECEKSCAQNSSHSCLIITVIHTNLLNLLRALSFSYFSFTGIQVKSFSQESSAFFLETERNKSVSLGHFNYTHEQKYLGHLCNVTNDLCFTTFKSTLPPTSPDQIQCWKSGEIASTTFNSHCMGVGATLCRWSSIKVRRKWKDEVALGASCYLRLLARRSEELAQN